MGQRGKLKKVRRFCAEAVRAEPLPANKLNLVQELFAAGLLTKKKAREVLDLPESPKAQEGNGAT